MMEEEDNVEILEKLLKKIKPWLKKPETNRRENKVEIETIKDLHGYFRYKSMTKMDPKKYESFVERLQKTLNLSDEEKNSLLDVLDCGENEEKVQILKFIDGKGYIYEGWYLAQKKDCKIDVAYAIYTANFKVPEKVIKEWALDWWYIIPTGWKTRVEMQIPTTEQQDVLKEWCRRQFYNEVHQKIENSGL